MASGLIAHGKKCVLPALDYFNTVIFNVNSKRYAATVLLFKKLRIFRPVYAAERGGDAADDVAALRTAVPGADDAFVVRLKTELPGYLAACDAVTTDKAADLLIFWRRHREDLPTWCEAFVRIALLQPSSAAAERVFSMLGAMLAARQGRLLADSMTASLTTRYNDMWRGRVSDDSEESDASPVSHEESSDGAGPAGSAAAGLSVVVSDTGSAHEASDGSRADVDDMDVEDGGGAAAAAACDDSSDAVADAADSSSS
ncbi:MAG TPA: hAT transposon family protein [Candidatus Limnocylindrales bacterium]|nr:hAT transposon family protein [Candidatus Limnocylindrales bacterium]